MFDFNAPEGIAKRIKQAQFEANSHAGNMDNYQIGFELTGEQHQLDMVKFYAEKLALSLNLINVLTARLEAMGDVWTSSPYVPQHETGKTVLRLIG